MLKDSSGEGGAKPLVREVKMKTRNKLLKESYKMLQNMLGMCEVRRALTDDQILLEKHLLKR